MGLGNVFQIRVDLFIYPASVLVEALEDKAAGVCLVLRG
jgi:hypothetical protein